MRLDCRLQEAGNQLKVWAHSQRLKFCLLFEVTGQHQGLTESYESEFIYWF